MVCEWKLCELMAVWRYNGRSLCRTHWELARRWIERLEERGTDLTWAQVAMLLDCSSKRKRKV